MKRILFLITIFCTLAANAQNYLISFTGSGASTTVSTVKVENLTKSTSLTLNGNDILRLTTVTGDNSIENKLSSEIKIYPNPMIDNSTLEIYPPAAGSAIISVFDMTGKPVAQIQSYLENYLQEFRLSGINSGFYLISVKGNTYQYSGKLLCNGKADGTIRIEKISNNQVNDEKILKTDFKGIQATVDMFYSTGDRLKFTGISGNYGTVKMDIPVGDKTITFYFIACSDADNNYPVVEIGTQVWMAENLKTTRYRNGDPIPNVTDNTAWSNLTTGAYSDYNNTISNGITYGKLYNWYTVVDSRSFCPTGWHMPTDAEWTFLATYLGGANIAGGKMKETNSTHWSNSGATNESGFTALPGGYRYFNGSFSNIGGDGYLWSSMESNTYNALYRHMNSSSNYLYSLSYDKKIGFSVRCLRD